MDLVIRIICTVLLGLLAISQFFKNIGCFENTKMVIVATFINWCIIAFIIVAVWIL